MKLGEQVTEEDRQLIENIEMLVSRIVERAGDASLKLAAMASLRELIRTSTTSISSIPKALKYLLPHYGQLKTAYAELDPEQTLAQNLAFILSVLAMTAEGDAATSNDCLRFYLASQKLNEPIDAWGHEYTKHLAKEVGDAHKVAAYANDQLQPIIDRLVPFFLKHNAEPDACDLLVEVDQVEQMVAAVRAETDGDYGRVCRYLSGCVPFELYPNDQRILRVCLAIYLERKDYPWALVTALRLNEPELIRRVFEDARDPITRRQLAYILARQRVAIDGVCMEEEELRHVMFNARLSSLYLDLAKELQIVPPKNPEDLFKVPSADPLRIVPKAETARSSLAIVLGNAFMNAGFCRDLFFEAADEEQQHQFLWKNKDVALVTAGASLGAVNMWNLGEGLAKLDDLFNQQQGSANPQAPNLQAGALLGIGLVHCGIRNESDPAFALLREQLEAPEATVRCGAILGLSFAYGGTQRSDVASALLPFIADADLRLSTFASLAIGNIMVGAADGDACSAILQAMMERDAFDLSKPEAKLYSLGLSLLLYNRPGASEAILETLAAIDNHPIGKDTQVLIKGLAYAGSGNINIVHELLGVVQQYNLDRKQTEDAKKALERAKAENRADKGESESPGGLVHESFGAVYAVLGVALISATEEIGQEMALRMFSHVLHYGDSPIRRTVPLAIGLLYASHPTLPVLDTLSKLSHDADRTVATNSILALGVVGAGTNHAKVAQLLRQLTGFHGRDPDMLLAVRIAQSLVHMGKGTLSISPIRMQRQLVSPIGLAGLLSAIVGCVSTCVEPGAGQDSAPSNWVLAQHPYLLYFLLTAATPRFLICLNAQSGEPESVPVRVGQAVDTVGQAGRPRTITGFQTHSTPVVIAFSEQAELATDQYVSKSPILEGIVLVEKLN